MFWLIVYLFTAEGEFMAKDVYEAASEQQCVEFASKYTRTIVNTGFKAQYNCVSDDEYRKMIGEDQ